MANRDLFAYSDEMRALTDRVFDHARARLSHASESIGPAPEPEPLIGQLSNAITRDGIGAQAAFSLFTDVIAPHCQAVDHPGFLAFVAHPPAVAASLFDMALSASSIFSTSWLEAAGATAAENLALRWLADLAGMPASAGGVFMSGATIANLNALAAARSHWRSLHPGHDRRLAVAMTFEAHSSAKMVARALDFEIVPVEGDARGRLTGPLLDKALRSTALDVCAVVATAGITNVGIVDDLATTAEVCAEHNIWLHVDAAYGGAALAVPETRALFDGIERADSLVIDPHKWLFTPLDCSALIYRDPAHARAAFTQHADYIAAFQETGEWNPGDYGMHLTRRARGLPFWFMLATYGSDAVSAAVKASLDLATETARLIDNQPELTLLMEPELSVVVFTRNDWEMPDYQRWSNQLLEEGTAFVLPTLVNGEPAMRFCFVNPRTTIANVTSLLDSLT